MYRVSGGCASQRCGSSLPVHGTLLLHVTKTQASSIRWPSELNSSSTPSPSHISHRSRTLPVLTPHHHKTIGPLPLSSLPLSSPPLPRKRSRTTDKQQKGRIVGNGNQESEMEWNRMGSLIEKKNCNRSRERHTIERDDMTRRNKGNSRGNKEEIVGG